MDEHLAYHHKIVSRAERRRLFAVAPPAPPDHHQMPARRSRRDAPDVLPLTARERSRAPEMYTRRPQPATSSKRPRMDSSDSDPARSESEAEEQYGSDLAGSDSLVPPTPQRRRAAATTTSPGRRRRIIAQQSSDSDPAEAIFDSDTAGSESLGHHGIRTPDNTSADSQPGSGSDAATPAAPAPSSFKNVTTRLYCSTSKGTKRSMTPNPGHHLRGRSHVTSPQSEAVRGSGHTTRQPASGAVPLCVTSRGTARRYTLRSPSSSPLAGPAEDQKRQQPPAAEDTSSGCARYEAARRPPPGWMNILPITTRLRPGRRGDRLFALAPPASSDHQMPARRSRRDAPTVLPPTARERSRAPERTATSSTCSKRQRMDSSDSDPARSESEAEEQSLVPPTPERRRAAAAPRRRHRLISRQSSDSDPAETIFNSDTAGSESLGHRTPDVTPADSQPDSGSDAATPAAPAPSSFKNVTIFSAYMTWLQGAFYGKNFKTAAQMSAQVFGIWQSVQRSPVFRPDDLLDLDRFDRLWFQTVTTNKQPGTVKSYLHSLSLFLKFLLAKKLVNRDKVEEAIAGINTIIRVQGRAVRVRRSDREVHDVATLLSRDDFRTFLGSPVVRDIEAALITASITSESTTSSSPVRPAPALPAPEGSQLMPAGPATSIVEHEATRMQESPRPSTSGLTLSEQRKLDKARVTPSPSSGEESESEWAPTPTRPGRHPRSYSSSEEGGHSAVAPPRAESPPRAAAPMVHGRRTFAPSESSTLLRLLPVTSLSRSRPGRSHSPSSSAQATDSQTYTDSEHYQVAKTCSPAR
ncbi:hypothetical protein ScPMuIL_003641 [Solemya velum]